MAFEPLQKFADDIKKQCLRQREYVKHYAGMGPQNLNEKEYKAYWSALSKDHVYFDVLSDYYEALKAIKKFVGQRTYVRKMLFELFPSESKGYFNAES